MVAGVGGSGTRIFPRILRRTGRYMGAHLNRHEDALDFYDFADRWIGPYLAAAEQGTPLDAAAMRSDFADCVRRYREPIGESGVPWGWKQPRSLHLLPFLRGIWPDMKLIHVVRDGRDVAFGKQPHLRKAGDAVLGPGTAGEPTPVRMMRFWTRVNTVAADYGEAEMGSDYLCVRFEDVCDDPAAAIDAMLRFSEATTVSGETRAAMIDEVDRPATIGRWREQDPELVEELVRVGAPALERFGYA